MCIVKNTVKSQELHICFSMNESDKIKKLMELKNQKEKELQEIVMALRKLIQNEQSI